MSPAAKSCAAGPCTPKRRPPRSAIPAHPAWPASPSVLGDPAEAGHQMIAESINDPAIADLNGDGRDDIVVASNEVYGAAEGGEDVSFSGITSEAAGSAGRLYAVDGATGKFLP